MKETGLIHISAYLAQDTGYTVDFSIKTKRFLDSRVHIRNVGVRSRDDAFCGQSLVEVKLRAQLQSLAKVVVNIFILDIIADARGGQSRDTGSVLGPFMSPERIIVALVR